MALTATDVYQRQCTERHPGTWKKPGILYVDETGVLYWPAIDAGHGPYSQDQFDYYDLTLVEGHRIDEQAPYVCGCGSKSFGIRKEKGYWQLKCPECGKKSYLE